MDFSDCKNVLIIRPDNMGDLLMSGPAIRALKNIANCKITVLCSTKAASVAALMAEINDLIIFDLPWLKFDSPADQAIVQLIDAIRQKSFDACVVFNVYSQNPAPCLMLAYLAGIPLRAAFSKENLYGLLSHWLPDDEPFFKIRHQIDRDLHLARFLGANTKLRQLRITEPSKAMQDRVMNDFGLTPSGYFVLHAGVSEKKRQYPKKHWVAFAKLLAQEYQVPIVLTGSKAEEKFNELLVTEMACNAKNLAGKIDLPALTAIIKQAKGMISVNTGPMHLAAALQTPLVALYAQSNPQHQPNHGLHRVLEYSVPDSLKSSNQIIRFVNEKQYQDFVPYPSPQQILISLNSLLKGDDR